MLPPHRLDQFLRDGAGRLAPSPFTALSFVDHLRDDMGGLDGTVRVPADRLLGHLGERARLHHALAAAD